MFKRIKTKEDYEIALEIFEGLHLAKIGTQESDEADKLAILIKNYEDKHFPIENPQFSIETGGGRLTFFPRDTDGDIEIYMETLEENKSFFLLDKNIEKLINFLKQ